jgi:hypothetical protein
MNLPYTAMLDRLPYFVLGTKIRRCCPKIVNQVLGLIGNRNARRTSFPNSHDPHGIKPNLAMVSHSAEGTEFKSTDFPSFSLSSESQTQVFNLIQCGALRPGGTCSSFLRRSVRKQICFPRFRTVAHNRFSLIHSSSAVQRHCERVAMFIEAPPIWQRYGAALTPRRKAARN